MNTACHVVTAIFCLGASLSVAAQDSTLTIGEMAARLDSAANLAGLPSANPAADSLLMGLLKPMRGSPFRIVHYKLLAENSRVLDDRRADRPGLPAFSVSRIDSVQALANQELLDALNGKNVDDALVDSLLEPVMLYHTVTLRDAMERNRRIVRRYERKYGPGAPRLNVLETLLSYFLQRVPGFGPGEEGAGPWEPVAAYSTTYLLAYQSGGQGLPGEFTVSSLWELGARYYLFEGWGSHGSLRHSLTPPYMGGGLAVGGRDEWFFVWPHRGARLGGFFDIAGFKVSLFPGDNFRLLLGRQFQIIPFAF